MRCPVATPTYVIRRIGDRYIPILQRPQTQVSRPILISGGALLGLMGLKRRGALGAAALFGGAALIARGALGYNPLSRLVCQLRPCVPNGSPSQTPSYQNDFLHRASQLPADLVDEQSMESFPASDPPSSIGPAIH